MSQLTIDVRSDTLKKLQQEASRVGKPVEVFVSELLDAQAPDKKQIEREQARAALRAAGLLTELGPELKLRAAQSHTSLEQVSAALSRSGEPLSEIVIEQRGPRA